jgi:tetratricopeptide (TPR) repeat protein
MDPASIAFAALAEEYRRAGRYDDAIATCTAGLLRHPAYLSAHVTLGRALLEVGQYDEAREELEHVLRLAPENLAAIRGLAEIHHRRGELPEGSGQYTSPAAARAPQAAAWSEPAPPSAIPSAPAWSEPTPPPGDSFDANPATTAPAFAPASDYGFVDPALPPVLEPDPVVWSPADFVEPARNPALEPLQAFLASILRARDDRAAARG